jgi:pimeloyl-ACP methyl ester carboxylesterase
MTSRHRIWVERAGARTALARWGEASSGRPPALLMHGTGFVAEIWDEVASALASRYTVYGLDRRGHRASHKPAASWILHRTYADSSKTGLLQPASPPFPSRIRH